MKKSINEKDFRAKFVNETISPSQKELLIDTLPFMIPELEQILGKTFEHYNAQTIFYPWLNKYYQILKEADFIKVRTSRNKNKITELEQQQFEGKTIAVIGQSTGSQVSYLLAQERLCDHLILADADDINLSNLNRIRAGILDIGINKAIVTARAIAEMDPYINLTVINEHVTVENQEKWSDLFKNADIIIDACDNIQTKLLIRFFAKTHKIPVLMETNDKGRIDIERFDFYDISIFHGAFPTLDETNLHLYQSNDLIKMMIDFLSSTGGISKKMQLSLPLIGTTLQSYPQLASETVSGAAILATCVRKIFLNESTASGTFFIDLETEIANFDSHL